MRNKQILTVHHQLVGESARLRRRGVPHQAVQLHAVHVPQGVQGVLRGDHPIVRRAVGGLAVQVGVPGEARGRMCHGATVSSLSVGLSLHQSYGFQGRYGNGWRECLQCLISTAPSDYEDFLCLSVQQHSGYFAL